MACEIIHGDALEVLKGMEANSVDAVVTDPPYGIAFMGKKWDYDVPTTNLWAECLRVLKPGGHLLAFAGTRTQHRMAVRIEDAGFEIRDMIAWVYGSGFPKSMDVSKAIDKAAGVARVPTGRVKPGHEGFANLGTLSSVQSLKGTLGGEGGFARPWMDDPEKVEAYHQETAPGSPEAAWWQGWGTALKPALEPITLARKPFSGTVAANVLEHGTGAINVDGCRVDGGPIASAGGTRRSGGIMGTSEPLGGWEPAHTGRWPANLIHDGSEEVLAGFPNVKGGTAVRSNSGGNTFGGETPKPPMPDLGYNDTGSAARFFYCAKASKADRDEGCEGIDERPRHTMSGGECIAEGRTEAKGKASARNHHPTVKPTALMRYLCRLVTPPGGTVMDPFTGSGSTGKAAVLEGFEFIGIEREDEYVAIAEARIVEAQRQLGLFA